MNKSANPYTGKYPLVTVGIPTFNGGQKISKALRSVLEQNYPNLEVIISDNCSTDNTREVCKALIDENSSVKYFRQPRNLGVMGNFEFVLHQATGDYFMWLCDDDALEPGILHRYVYFLMNNTDYALVSGEIQYWIGDQKIFRERNFNFEERNAYSRLIHFYFKVVYGSIFYGLMKTEIARKIPLSNRIGDDWHFVASVAFLGKIRNLDQLGYHKRCGGISRNFKEYAKAMGAAARAARHPHVQIARDAFANIFHQSPVYRDEHRSAKLALAISSFLAVLISFYGKQYPFILGGKVKRLLL